MKVTSTEVVIGTITLLISWDLGWHEASRMQIQLPNLGIRAASGIGSFKVPEKAWKSRAYSGDVVGKLSVRIPGKK